MPLEVRVRRHAKKIDYSRPESERALMTEIDRFAYEPPYRWQVRQLSDFDLAIRLREVDWSHRNGRYVDPMYEEELRRELYERRMAGRYVPYEEPWTL